MSRRKSAWSLGLLIAISLAVSIAWWRGRPVDVSPAANAGNPRCVQMAERLPRTIRGDTRVGVSTSSPAVAAWGRPAVIWRCGVTPPGPTTQECITVNGIDWIRTPLQDGSSFTTYGREPASQVLVPRNGPEDPEPFVLPAFAPAAAVAPAGDRRCS
ncbi:MAG: DUF3515 domain-containing protein [Actinomycetota bacterium]